MKKHRLAYEGKAKKLYEIDDETAYLVEYLDQATALNGVKKEAIKGKGQLNNQITSQIFEFLTNEGVENHFLSMVSKSEQLIKRVDMIPLEVVVRNVAAGSFSKRLGIAEGVLLPTPILEFYFKDDQLNDPFINDEHILFLGVATGEEIQGMKDLAFKVNKHLCRLFSEIGIRLIDFKIEIGRSVTGELLLADEISPDTCRLWDLATNEHLDKDIFRRDLGDLVPVYEEVLQRLMKRGV